MAETLGVVPQAGGARAAVPAPGAEAVELCLFDATGEVELARHPLAERLGEVFLGFVADVPPGTRYGLRAHGPPALGFDGEKLLTDPWATVIDRPYAQHPGLSRRGTDSAPLVPKAILSGEPAPAAPRGGPVRAEVIYELAVRAFTRRHPDIPEALRGTVAGLAHPAAIAHLQRLGVTTIELLPCAAWIDERHLPPLGLRNAWGYNPVLFGAPDPRLAPGGWTEWRDAVAALHAAGLSVILDVVLNHSGEGDAAGPTLSLRGLGAAHWYRFEGGALVNDSGCGNTLALDRPWPLRLAMDALRRWASIGIDGFRLDLATSLGRRGDRPQRGFDADAPLLAAIRQDPLLRGRRFIAEPWDLGPDGYRLGGFPAGWGEWNDRFRDQVRCFWRGDRGLLGALATRLAGSADAFEARPSGDSVNFLAAHDGFTLADLVSHARPHNEANGEQGRDGRQDEPSWNHGVEGATTDPLIHEARAADARALLALLFAARGTPMLGMGDEAGRSQGGNNNAYAQDNETAWFDWAGADAARIDFTARLIAARRAHPALHDTRPLDGGAAAGSGLPDVAWLTPGGTPMGHAEWHEPDRRHLVAVLHAGDDRVLVAVNREDFAIEVVLPATRWGFAWRVLVDSAAPTREGRVSRRVACAARSVLLLAETAAAPPGREAPDPALLARLAEAAGIGTRWHDLRGVETEVPAQTLRAVLSALGLRAETKRQAREALARLRAPRALPAHVAAAPGEAVRLHVDAAPRARVLVLTLEDGRVVEHPLAAGLAREIALPPAPPGRHRLQLGDVSARLTVAPPACFLPGSFATGERRFAITCQTYALRRAGDGGIGDYAALALLGAQPHGASWIGISPPHALIAGDRERASPYQPSDRRFLEPALIAVDRLLEEVDTPALRAALDAAEPVLARLRERPLIDHPAVWAAKRAVIDAAWPGLTHPDFDAFRRAGGAALDSFAAFQARAASEAPELHLFAQWIADRQLARAHAARPLYRDLAIGCAPDGAEASLGEIPWLAGFSIGAPPDPLAPQGQVWGLPPPDPLAGLAAGLDGFALLLAANMRHAAALRVDHVLGLQRLFIVPEGAEGRDGCYLAMPREALIAELACASHAARCTVIGEDLGTVPDGLRERLAAAAILSTRVLAFEERPPAEWPRLATACLATHDLPTVAGWWEGADLEERDALGLLAEPAAAHAARAAAKARLLPGWSPEAPAGPGLAAALHAGIAAGPSWMALVQAEDLAGERVAVNLPGTDRERPNWRRRLSLPVETLCGTETARAVLGVMGAERAAPPPPDEP